MLERLAVAPVAERRRAVEGDVAAAHARAHRRDVVEVAAHGLGAAVGDDVRRASLRASAAHAPAVGDEPADQRAADEARAAGDECCVLHARTLPEAARDLVRGHARPARTIDQAPRVLVVAQVDDGRRRARAARRRRARGRRPRGSAAGTSSRRRASGPPASLALDCSTGSARPQRASAPASAGTRSPSVVGSGPHAAGSAGRVRQQQRHRPRAAALERRARARPELRQRGERRARASKNMTARGLSGARPLSA